MTTSYGSPGADEQSGPDIRILTAISWVVGPTVIFLGWFLMAVIAGSQRPGAPQDETPLALIFLFALITSVPLILVSLAGGVTTMLTSTVPNQRRMNFFGLVWNIMVFGIYFGFLGIIGSLPEDGFPITPVTISALIPISLITIVVPIVLYLINRRTIGAASTAVSATTAAPGGRRRRRPTPTTSDRHLMEARNARHAGIG